MALADHETSVVSSVCRLRSTSSKRPYRAAFMICAGYFRRRPYGYRHACFCRHALSRLRNHMKWASSNECDEPGRTAGIICASRRQACMEHEEGRSMSKSYSLEINDADRTISVNTFRRWSDIYRAWLWLPWAISRRLCLGCLKRRRLSMSVCSFLPWAW